MFRSQCIHWVVLVMWSLFKGSQPCSMMCIRLKVNSLMHLLQKGMLRRYKFWSSPTAFWQASSLGSLSPVEIAFKGSEYVYRSCTDSVDIPWYPSLKYVANMIVFIGIDLCHCRRWWSSCFTPLTLWHIRRRFHFIIWAKRMLSMTSSGMPVVAISLHDPAILGVRRLRPFKVSIFTIQSTILLSSMTFGHRSWHDTLHYIALNLKDLWHSDRPRWFLVSGNEESMCIIVVVCSGVKRWLHWKLLVTGDSWNLSRIAQYGAIIYCHCRLSGKGVTDLLSNDILTAMVAIALPRMYFASFELF